MSKDVRRRLELYAANPRCDANVQAALGGVSMLEVAQKLGLAPAFGQSPFALQRGQTFERTLFEDDATPLRRALIERKVLPANAAGFVDLRGESGLDEADAPSAGRCRRWRVDGRGGGVGEGKGRAAGSLSARLARGARAGASASAR